VQEFLLCNHPLDCPICDKSGECRLQDYYMDHGRYTPVMIEDKYKKHKATPIGPTIVLDTERCILCSRCVRFCDEVSKSSELGLFYRNNKMEIGIVPGTELDNPYSGNLVDICPVGALGDRDFRFRCRVWYLRTAKSICPGCAKGCNIVVDHQQQRNHVMERRRHKAAGDRVMRLRPRWNLDVNRYWMCDEGRYDYRWHDENRLFFAAAVREDGVQAEVLFRRAIEAAAQRLKAVDAKEWAVVLSAQMSNEDLFLAKTLFQDRLGIGEIFIGHTEPGSEDDLLRRADKNPNTAGAKALGLEIDTDGSRLRGLAGKHVWAIIHDVVGALGEGTEFATLIYQGSNICATSMAADVALPAATCFEKYGTFTNEDQRVQWFERAFLPIGDAENDIQIFHRLAGLLGVDIPSGEAQDIFDVMASQVDAFRGLSHESLGDLGAPLATAQGVAR
jgi:NADH-quinone oxidoreductase subunit G